MTESYFIPLNNRSVVEISREDSARFLQGLITKNIDSVTEKKSIYSCMLTPQGKFLFDFFIVLRDLGYDSAYLIDINKAYKEEFIKKLKMYKLRSKVEIKDVSNKYKVISLIGDEVYNGDIKNIAGYTYKFCNGVAFIDPRNERLYARYLVEKNNNYQLVEANGFTKGLYDLYEYLRIKNTIPEGITDLISNESFPLQFGLDNLNAIDFDKGCYVGQEVTTRSKHRGKSKKFVCTISLILEKKNFVPKSDVILCNNKKAGKLLSYHNNIGLALMNINQVVNSSKITTYSIDDIPINLV